VSESSAGSSALVATGRTAATVLALALYVLICGPPTLLWTLVSRRSDRLYAVGLVGIRLGLALAGIRVEVSGARHVQRGAAVYASNHSSNVDPPAVFLALRAVFPRLRILYKTELRRLPVLVWAFDLAGFVAVERANREQSWPAVDRAAAALAAGDSFLVFPEGTRSRAGSLLPFKKGGFVMAIKAQAPIVPVAVAGGRAAMRKGSPLIWPARVRVILGPPVPTAGLTLDDRDRLASAVRDAIEALLRPSSGS
jgi:1-acyl-sn-glycerol-3-phosphate acyltransferase